MDSANAARALMADSLGFHIIFALLGVGLPLAISALELWAIRKKDDGLLEAARRLSILSLVLIVAGVASGTIIAIQMSLMWSGLVEFGGPILGLAFMLEGYAFLLEAIFLAFYVGSWKKIKGLKHWLLGLPVIAGSLGSAIFITSANAWMQNPTGFTLENGQVANADVWRALFTRTTFFMTSHSILGYYAATFLVVAGGYAWVILRRKPKGEKLATAKRIIAGMTALATGASLLVGLLGHMSLQYLSETEPRKFAAIEQVPQTTSHAPYVIGGSLSADGQSVEGGIKIPNGLSLLTGYSANTEVPGLNDYPRETWPMLFINRLFEAKMLLVGFMIGVPVVFLGLYVKWRAKAFNRPLLWALLLSGPVAVIIIELGWMIAEFGRQPYAVNGLLTTRDAFTDNPGVVHWGYIFPSLYVGLFIVTWIALRVVMKRFNPEPKA